MGSLQDVLHFQGGNRIWIPIERERSATAHISFQAFPESSSAGTGLTKTVR